MLPTTTINQLTTTATDALTASRRSGAKCIDVTNCLIAQIEQSGMTPELDAQAANILARTKKTITRMKELRSPVTRIFDAVRAEFTALERSIDPANPTSPGHRLKAMRDTYAQQIYAAAEAERRKAEAARQLNLARTDYRNQCDRVIRAAVTAAIINAVDNVTRCFDSLTLDNADDVANRLRATTVDIDPRAALAGVTFPPAPALSHLDVACIHSQAVDSAATSFAERYRAVVTEARDNALHGIPARLDTLRQLAKGEADAQHLHNVMAAQTADLTAQAVDAADRQTKIDARRSAAMAAFDAASSAQEVAAILPKTDVKVKRTIVVTNPDAIPILFAMWWEREGSQLPLDQLAKMFRKQITFCERLANGPEQEQLTHPHIIYSDQVTAK